VWFDESVISLGDQPAGVFVHELATIRNYSDKAVEVIGVEASCTCTIASAAIPCTVEAFSKIDLPIEIELKESLKLGPWRQKVIYLVNENGAIKRYLVTIEAEITKTKVGVG
jgi:hypothetical protein